MPKIHKAYQPLYASEKRYVYVKGGRGSGKSFAVSDYALRLTYDSNRVVLFMRYTMVAASISIVPEFTSQMERQECRGDFDIKGSEIINIHTGSKIIFKGVKTSSLNQTANLKSIEGLTDAIYDEFEEHPDQDSFDKLDESIRSVGASNKLVLVSNALHLHSWQSKQFFEQQGLYFDMTDRIHTTFEHNYENLSESWHKKRLIVKNKYPKKYDKDYLGKDYSDDDNALWNSEMIIRSKLPEKLRRIVVAIDPAVTSNKDSDEHGIMVVGLGFDDRFYVLKDCSGIYTPNGMATVAVNAYHDYKADRVIGEVNNGGDFIETVIKNLDKSISYKSVRATRGKVTRAEPVVSLYEQDKVSHCDDLTALEIEMTTWNPRTSSSPNRIDALVWGLTELNNNNNKISIGGV